MPIADRPPLASRVFGPRTTWKGFDEKASRGSLNDIVAIQMRGNAAITVQRASPAPETRRSAKGCRSERASVTLSGSAPMVAPGSHQERREEDGDPDDGQHRRRGGARDGAVPGLVRSE